MERKLRNSHGSWAPVCLWPQTDVLNSLEMEKGERTDFLSSNLNTKEIPPWATQEDNRFLPAALRLASPWG